MEDSGRLATSINKWVTLKDRLKIKYNPTTYSIPMTSRSRVIKKHGAVNAKTDQMAAVTAMQNPVWKKKGNIYYAFSPILEDENGKQNVMEFNMKGTVVKSFL